MAELQIKDDTDRAEKLLQKTQQAFAELGLSTDTLPQTMAPAAGKLKLVFVGQYSAGKSSIIQMLTGLKTKIGAAITTQEAGVYPWGDLEIIDTPGIETGIRPDHDERTYEEINHAALLVFVITAEGFDQTMGTHFQKLAQGDKRGRNMVLVVNKMDRTPSGNTPEQQEVLLGDIGKVIAPLTPAELFTSFVSAGDYEEAQTESDAELRAELLKESGYETLVEHLNAFARERGLSARAAEPVYTLKSVLDAVAGTEEDREAADEAKALLERKARLLENAKSDAIEDIQQVAMNLQSTVVALGRQAAHGCVSAESEEAANTAIQTKIKEAEQSAQDAEQRVQDILVRMANEIDSGITQEAQGTLMQTFLSHAQVKCQPVPASSTAEEESGDDTSFSSKAMEEALNHGGGMLFQNISSVEQVFTSSLKNVGQNSLKSFSESIVHSAVKDIGHLFGHNFKPWEALKITKFAGKAASAALSLGLNIYEKIKEDEEREKLERDIKEARQNIVNAFTSMAQECYHELNTNARQAAENLVAPLAQDAAENLQQLEDARALAAKRKETLGALQQETDALLTSMEA